MSRTFRRKDKDFVKKWTAHYREGEYIKIGWCWETRTQWGQVGKYRWDYYTTRHKISVRTLIYYPLSVEKRAEDVIRWQRDRGYCGFGPNKSFRQHEQRKLRSQAKAEISRYKKDDSYEIMALSKPPYPYWD